MRRTLTTLLSAALLAPLAAVPASAQQAEPGFVSIFDGKTLDGWMLVRGRGEGYGVKDGVLFCAEGGGGNLLTEKQYDNFVLRFEFKMPPEGSNNGLGIRTPKEGDAAYQGMELQILDEKAALAGKTLGGVGAGAIGAEIGRRASHFGMRVLGIRRSGEPLPDFEAVVRPDRLLEVLAQSDFVCVTVPATDATSRLIGPEQFRAMKAGAFFVNIARGSVVDEAELIRALRDGSLAGAALDVYEKEPPEDDNPLWDMPNVIMTPHISGMLDTNEERLVSIFADNLVRYRSGAPLRNMVDLARGY